MKLAALYQIFLECSAVTTDSRNCPANSLFIALKGESFNGNAFAGKALEAGCKYVVVDEPHFVPEGDKRFILVDDCLRTLQELANYHRRQLGTRYRDYRNQWKDHNKRTHVRCLVAIIQCALYAGKPE